MHKQSRVIGIGRQAGGKRYVLVDAGRDSAENVEGKSGEDRRSFSLSWHGDNLKYCEDMCRGK